MKKIIGLLITKILAVIMANVSFIWVIIEFILYIEKDQVFNWWSVLAFVISVIVSITLVVFAIVWEKKELSMLDKLKKKENKNPNSLFQKRLDKIK